MIKEQKPKNHKGDAIIKEFNNNKKRLKLVKLSEKERAELAFRRAASKDVLIK